MIIHAPVISNPYHFEELAGIHMSEKRKSMAISFMENIRKTSCKDLTDEDIFLYREEYLPSVCVSEKIPFFLTAPEEAWEWVFKDETDDLLSFYTSFLPFTVFAKKVCCYLAEHGIRNASMIDHAIRQKLSLFLSRTGYVCTEAVISSLDRMKLEATRLENEQHPFKKRSLPLSSDEVFLLYHPYYPGAAAAYHTEDKDTLFYDLTALFSDTIRRQFIQLLDHAMHLPEQENKLRAYYIQPLRLLYETAVRMKWTDLEMLTCDDETAFNTYADAYYGKSLKWHHQILFKVRRFLFLNADEIHWDATVWFLDRFHLSPARISPSLSVKTFRFTGLKNENNRRLFQTYMHYLLGTTDRSITTIKTHYKDLTVFLLFMEEQDLPAADLTRAQFEEFLTYIEEERSYGCHPFNSLCEHIRCFYLFLSSHNLADPLAFDPGFYRKKLLIPHNDRTVPDDVTCLMMHMLPLFPEDLGLMYLHLLTTGLRIGEICTIRAGWYLQKDGLFWLRIYQHKM